MSMPYTDTFTFMNAPVFRNTGYDCLLNPELALKKVEQNWAQGGGYYSGSTWLPGYQFPGVDLSGLQFPQIQWPGMKKTETEEEKKEREAKEKAKAEDESKPEHQKAKNLETLFGKIKKIADDKTNKLTAITKEQETAVKDAMKKETAEERYNAMIEVFNGIDIKTVRKAVLNDVNVREELRKAGYNFNFNANQYSVPNSDMASSVVESSAFIEELTNNIVSPLPQQAYTKVGQLSGYLLPSNNQKYVMSFISKWNDEHSSSSDRGYLRFLGAHLPTDKTSVHNSRCAESVAVLVDAICAKAKSEDYNGCEQIKKHVDKLKELKETCCKGATNATTGTTTYSGLTQVNINKVADEFDKLYVLLRMQDAVRIRDNVAKDFGYLNEVKADVINNNLIVEETIEDLKAEGFNDGDVPAVSELPKPKKTQEEVQAEIGKLNKAEEKLNYLLSIDNPDEAILEPVNPSNESCKVYKLKGIPEEDEDNKFYQIINNKLVEVVKNDKSEFVQKDENPDDTNIVNEIKDYHAVIAKANELIKDGYIVKYPCLEYEDSRPVENPKNDWKFYKAAGGEQFFVIKDNQLWEIKNCTNVTYIQKTVDGKTQPVLIIRGEGLNIEPKKLTVKNLEEVKEDKINCDKNTNKKKQEKEDAEFNALKDYDGYRDNNGNFHSLTCLNDIDYEFKLNITRFLTKKTQQNSTFKAIDTNGYFQSECNGKVRYYVYNPKLKRLVCLTHYDVNGNPYGVIDVENGIIRFKQSGITLKKECQECIIEDSLKDGENYENVFAEKVQGYGLAFAQSINYYNGENNYPEAKRKLNTLVAYVNSSKLEDKKKATFVYNFIKGYQSYYSGIFNFSSTGICKKIFNDEGFERGGSNVFNSKLRYIAMIAKGMKLIANASEYTEIKYTKNLNKEQIEQRNNDIILLDSIAKGNFYSIEDNISKLDNAIERILEHAKAEFDKNADNRKIEILN